MFPILKSSALNVSTIKSCHPLCVVSILVNKFDFAFFHTSRIQFKFKPPKPRPTTYKRPVDWLPFPWHRRPQFSLYDKSGDYVKEIIVDPTLPKPGFELSEELKSADEVVKRAFSLGTASKREKREILTKDILKRVQRHPFDFDSLEVRIALKTIQIRALYEHHRDNVKHEKKVSTIVFPIIIQKRNKLLNQLWKIDEDRFNWILKELQLYFTPTPLGVVHEKYCKKWDLRRLTREYCAKVVAEKKTAYHEELKKEQEEFLEEKKKILAWIEEEEKALENL